MGDGMARRLASPAVLVVASSALESFSHAVLTQALFICVLTNGLLLGAYHYLLDLEEKWQVRLWRRVAS
jgi:hypothetical protein